MVVLCYTPAISLYSERLFSESEKNILEEKLTAGEKKLLIIFMSP